jgi:hypothetical protein
MPIMGVHGSFKPWLGVNRQLPLKYVIVDEFEGMTE